MNRRCTAMVVSVVVLLAGAYGAAKAKPLQIYFIDVEGGQATLLVTPSQQSVLIDTGWAGSRDAERILAAAKGAGLKHIDYVLITHYHQDHVGGVADLQQRIPVGIFIDHGSDVEDSDSARTLYKNYEKAIGHSKRIHLMPGEGLPLQDVRFEIVVAGGQHITGPLPAAGEANFYCAPEAEAKTDSSENAQSIGVLISYGNFRFVDLGDLTKTKELELVCPNNLVGTVSLYLLTHHGMAPDNSKALVWALHPQVAISNNGAHKGGDAEAWQIVRDSPRLTDIWQLHYAVDADKEHNAGDNFVANQGENSDGHYIKVEAERDGSFVVTNSRNGFSRKYGSE
ncbi:MAG: MBL fold metallo-hydrolase [Acidobacteriaceae bacterium]|nr:MBL fold metallo-hydrolase [Acidobacteriaceae bacterium]